VTAQDVTVTTPEGTIAGWREGHGDTVAVLLHGGPGLSDLLESLAGLLGDEFTTIRFQQRGLPPTTIREPYTVEANVADAAAVVDQAAGGRAWIIGFSWGGHLALHMLAACPERVAGAIIIDPLGAFIDVLEEFGERLTRTLSPQQRRRMDEIEQREQRGEVTAEESLESFEMIWPGYFADPTRAPAMPPVALSGECYIETMASITAHAESGTLAKALPRLPPGLPVLFIHGADSPMPVRTSTDTAALIPHGQVELIERAGHFVWLDQPQRTHAAISAFVAEAVAAAAP
jgi:pimeloyl-ACP methyl ester carboxylesterase